MEIGEDCDAGSCSCRVVSLQCFPLPDSTYPIYDNYAGEDDNQCRANTKDCEIQPDQRSDEKTWAECDDDLCFDNSGSPKNDTIGECWTKHMECKFPFKDEDGQLHNECTS